MKRISSFLLMFLLAAFIIFMSLKQSENFSGAEYDVRIVNGFTDNSSLALVIWCTSDNKDIGGRALQVGDDFSWSVKTNLWGATPFHCTMKWDATRKQFDAFQVQRDVQRCGPLRTCFWLVREDGFYFSNDQVNWKKDFSW
ncbi:hypothetical protein AAG906_037875 [Vitis piasezkii]|nr:S-protein homolog 31 [Vitis vinifera]XP_034678327.1 S-protein homolog 31-like [Vitis riparia]XP_034685360.1 S-protein homolog 31-like [Vitis riparia]RVW88426.1 S-protein-like 21 [Vitis vinifera]|eukprot:XP_010650221.1 PREDICTED: uncharacterized protein LOC100252771 [Vitis vinifera]